MSVIATARGSFVDISLSYSVTSQSTVNNSSNVYIAILAVSNGGAGYNSSVIWQPTSFTATVNGRSVSASPKFDNDFITSSKVIYSLSTTIYHNNDGSANLVISNISGSFREANSGGDGGGKLFPLSRLGSASVPLPKINRNPSTITCQPAYIGGSMRINVSRQSSNFTHSITYNFAGTSGTVLSKSAVSNFQWTVPTSFYKLMGDEKSKQITLVCSTYSGNTYLGQRNAKTTIMIDEATNKPTLAPTVKDVNPITLALTGDENVFIRNLSNAQYAVNATPKNSATIKTQTVTVGNTTYKDATGEIPNVPSGEFKFYVQDSRGISNSVTITKTVLDYIRLTCDLANNIPETNGNLTLEVKGNFFAGTFGGEKNTLQVQYRRKDPGQEQFGAWINMTPQIDEKSNSYYASTQITGLDYKSAYVFQARAIDKLITIESLQRVMQATPVFDWSKDDFNVNVPIHMDNVPVLDIEQDTKKVCISTENSSISIRPDGPQSTLGELLITPDALTYNGSPIGGGGGGRIVSYSNPTSVPLKNGMQYIIYAAGRNNITFNINGSNYVYTINDINSCIWMLWVKTAYNKGSMIRTSGTRQVMSVTSSTDTIKVSSSAKGYIIITIG